MTKAKPHMAARRAGSLPIVIGALALAAIVAALTQQMLAERVAGFLAGVWVQAMNVVIGLIGAIFGGA